MRPQEPAAPRGGRSPYRGSARRRPPRHGPRATRRIGWAPHPPRARTGPSSRRGHCPSRARSPSRPGCARRPTGTGQRDQAYVHAKPTLTVIFHRFNKAPVGRMARTGCCRSSYSRTVQRWCRRTGAGWDTTGRTTGHQYLRCLAAMRPATSRNRGREQERRPRRWCGWPKVLAKCYCALAIHRSSHVLGTKDSVGKEPKIGAS
jgi:hypothetical protein